MTIKLNKPILVTGITLSIVLWVWQIFQQKLAIMGEWGLLSLIVMGSGFWLWQRKPSKLNVLPVSPLKREKVEAAIADGEKMLLNLKTEAPEQDITPLKENLAHLPQTFTRETLTIGITGGSQVGKTCLKHALETAKIADHIQFRETESLFTENENRERMAREVADSSDLVLFMVTGDLTESQWQVLQDYKNNYQRVLLLFNKQDHYIPEERAIILQQLKQRVKTLIPEADIIPIAVAPKALKVRQYQESGKVEEWMEDQAANLGTLETRLSQIINQEKEQLIWGSIWRSVLKIKAEGKKILNQVRRDRAIPIIEKYQWIAAATALANPVATLDLLTTAAINGQMIVDLSQIYQQKFSFSQASTLGGTMGKLMVQLGLVELSTQAIGSLLKSHFVTYLAGGTLQGISAAYLTRLAGLSLVEYFQEQENSNLVQNGLNVEKLTQKLKQVFQQNQRTTFLQDFVKQAINYQNCKLSGS